MTLSDGEEHPFAFVMTERAEDVEDYGPGGLLPVKLGDIFGPGLASATRYRIMGKLGRGSYSTVWLARDITAKKIVAIKAVRASDSENTREAEILERLRTLQAEESSNVLQLRDAFSTRSPNGIHSMIVTEPVVLLRHFVELLPTRTAFTSSIVRQLLEGIAFIHEHGVVHGDLHPSNIGVAITSLDVLSEMNFWDRTGAPDVIPVVARDSTREQDSFPPYIITENIQLGQFLQETFPETLQREPRVRILDFGCARFADEIPCPRWHTPVEYAAPELLYAEAEENNRDAVWDWPVDIWSLGCTIWAIATRRALFSRPILEDMVACDNIPTTWLSFSQRVTSECGDFERTPDTIKQFWDDKVQQMTEEGYSWGAAQALVALLRRMLRLDATHRPSARVLLQDPYFDIPPSGHLLPA